MKNIKLFLLLSLLLFSCFGVAMADDLDDGISKSTDDGIASYDDMGKGDKNIKFIIMNSKSQAAVAQHSAQRGASSSSSSSSSGSGDNNMNSVVMGAGSTIHGDVIIIDESKGDKIQTSGK
ncbi:MAG: hypothetical protein KKG47_05340 [Proteobacteria bacterium]|nr:hypothetical protein [Pseudomonadota bacterium]MBU1736900.1 hypothetical protein [Pseudomonadota bacterium]